jgi:hypothetical protein
VIDVHARPAVVVGNVADAVGDRTPEFGNDEVMYADFFRRTLRRPLAPVVREVADRLILLGVDRDGRFARGQRRLHLIVDVVELRIAIGMVRALPCLAIELQTVIKLVEQLAHRGAADLVAWLPQPLAELAQVLAATKAAIADRRVRSARRDNANRR